MDEHGCKYPHVSPPFSHWPGGEHSKTLPLTYITCDPAGQVQSMDDESKSIEESRSDPSAELTPPRRSTKTQCKERDALLPKKRGIIIKPKELPSQATDRSTRGSEVPSLISSDVTLSGMSAEITPNVLAMCEGTEFDALIPKRNVSSVDMGDMTSEFPRRLSGKDVESSPSSGINPNISSAMTGSPQFDAELRKSSGISFDPDGKMAQTNCQAPKCNEAPRPSSSEDAVCRICQDDAVYERLVSPCLCSGTVGYVHVSCLNTWLQVTSRTSCELCGFPFPVKRQLAPFREYLRHPRANMDLPNLVCDVACLVVLTPLLLSSVYLSATGALRYESLGRAGSLCAVVTLLLALVLVYLSWACLAVVYHVRVWQAWRERNSIVSTICEGEIDGLRNQIIKLQPCPAGGTVAPSLGKGEPTKCSTPSSTRADADTRAFTAGGDTAVLLAPINRLSGWIKVSNRVSIGSHSLA